MKKILLRTSIFASVVGLQACGGAVELPECAAVSAAEWAGSSQDIGPIIEGYGAVHETYITMERRGEYGVGSSVCQMARVYCPKPHADKGCQTYQCNYVEVTGAMVKIKDYQGTRFYTTPKSVRVVWDGQALRCGPA